MSRIGTNKRPQAPSAAPPPAEPAEIVSYKGFNLDWTCRGMRYEVGQTYQHDGDVVACRSGYHACEYPLDVFGYYPPGVSRYAEVRQSGDISRDRHDTKIASARLAVTVELFLHEMIARAVKWIFNRATPENTEHVTGDLSAASVTGYQSAASATGYWSAVMAIGHGGRAMGAAGNALFLVYRAPNTGEILHAWAGIVGRDGVEPGVWYSLGSDGHPVASAQMEAE